MLIFYRVLILSIYYCWFNEVMERDEKKLHYLLGDGGGRNSEALGGLTAGKRVTRWLEDARALGTLVFCVFLCPFVFCDEYSENLA